MKNKKIVTKIFVMLLALITSFGLYLNVKANEVVDLITVGEVKSTEYLKGIYVNVRKGTKGEYVYCIEASKWELLEGHKLHLDGVIDDAGIAYLIANGYPYKKFTGIDNLDYYITQIAVWLYYREFYNVPASKLDKFVNGEYDDVDITKTIKTLYNEAIEARKNGFVSPSLNVTSDGNLTMSNDLKYFQSNLVSVKLIGTSKYSVSINENSVGAIVTDKDGNVKNTFNANEQFMIKIPSENILEDSVNISVNINASGIINKAYRYRPDNEKRQKVVYSALFGTIVPLSKYISFSYKAVDVEFSKIDITNNKELEGAHLEIRDSNNSLIKSWVSSNKTTFFKLKPGKYTLKETIAPEGYELSEEVINFTVKSDGTTSKVVMKNTPFKIVKFTKVDATNNKEIEGAHLELRDSNDKIVASWVSNGEPHYLQLSKGKYTLKEIIAPKGYELSTETIEFEVLENGIAKAIVMKNTPYIDVPKTDLNASSIVMIIGGMLLLFGISVVYRNVKEQ